MDVAEELRAEDDSVAALDMPASFELPALVNSGKRVTIASIPNCQAQSGEKIAACMPASEHSIE